MSIATEVYAAIRAAIPAATSVHDAHVPRRADGSPLDLTYVVIYPDLGLLSSLTLAAELAASDITFRLVYVSVSRTSVEALCAKTRAAILGKRFTDGTYVAEFDPDDFHNTTPVSWDESVADRLVMYATDEFRALAHK